MGDLILFPEGKRVPEGTKLDEEDVSVIGLLEAVKSAVSDGKCRRIFVTILAEDNNTVHLWCNLDHFALRLIGDALGKKSVEIDEYLKQHVMDRPSGEDYDRRH